MRASLLLPGWDEESFWGYDRETESWFAQLFRNGVLIDVNSYPHIWISPGEVGPDGEIWGVIDDPTDVEVAIALATGIDPEVIADLTEPDIADGLYESIHFDAARRARTERYVESRRAMLRAARGLVAS